MDPVFSGAEIVQMVIEAEEIGVGFYECLAEAARSPEAKNVFARIVEEEKEHVRELERLVDAVHGYRPTGTYSEEYYAYLSALVDGKVFKDRRACRQMARDAHDEAEAARLAASYEKEIILFIHELRRFVPEAEKATVDRLLEDESKHVGQFHGLAVNRQS